MGVIGLRSFLQAHPEFAEKIRITPDADPSRSPVIVFDGSSLAFYLLRMAQMNPLFPDYTLVVNAVRTFCGAFKTAGFKLVVFADGNPPNAKMETVVERREQIIAVCATVYENFGNELYAALRELNSKFLPLFTMMCVQDALREFQVELHFSAHEADHDIASYAQKHKCFAIISQDTDFLIFEVARYIPLDTVHIDAQGRISAECYSSERTASLLKFNKKHLPIFGALVGNDYTSQYCGYLHGRLGIVSTKATKISDTVRAVARYLETYNGDMVQLTTSLLGSLPKDDKRTVGAVLYEAEAAYQLRPFSVPAKIHPHLWEAYARGRLHYAAIGVHEFAEFKCPLLLEDPRHSTHSLNNAFSDLRLRLYAALLPAPIAEVRSWKGKKKAAAAAAGSGGVTSADSPRVVLEYIQSERRYKTRKVTVPEPTTPLAVELLAPATGADLRIQSLLALFLPNHTPLLALPPLLLPVGLLARYLLVNTVHPQLQLMQTEWRVIVATLLALRLKTPMPPAAAEFEAPPERRGVHTANFAQLACWYLYLTNDVCGQPLALGPTYNAFDGRLWIHCWGHARDPAALCLGNADLLAAFNTVVAAATAELPPYVWREPVVAKPAKKQQGGGGGGGGGGVAAGVPLPGGGNKFALLGDMDG